jgi:hypothetical protein
LRPLRLETRKGLFSKLMRGLQGKAKEKTQSPKAKA